MRKLNVERLGIVLSIPIIYFALYFIGWLVSHIPTLEGFWVNAHIQSLWFNLPVIGLKTIMGMAIAIGLIIVIIHWIIIFINWIYPKESRGQ